MKQLWPILLLPAMVAAPASAQGEDVIATVNRENITSRDLYDVLRARLGALELEQMIRDMIVRQAAQDQKIIVTADEVEKTFQEAKDHYDAALATTGKGFAHYLLSRNLTEELFKQEIEVKLILRKAVEGQVTVTDKDVADFYDRSRQRLFHRPERRRVTDLAVREEDLAVTLHKQAVAGEPGLEELAHEHHAVPSMRERRGNLGYVTRGDAARGNTVFQNKVFELGSLADISEPFEDPPGWWHIVRLDDIQPAGDMPFDEAKDQIRQLLREQQITAAGQRWFLEQKEKARVERFGDFKLSPGAAPAAGPPVPGVAPQ